jgi:hypothetical protein
MNPENTKILFDRFEFVRPKPTDTIRNNLMLFGCEIGPGWYPLLYRICENIEKVLIEDKIEGFQFTQVKEKWARLVVYTNGNYPKIEKLIEDAEDDSAHICEDCGCPGYVERYRGWYMARCVTCWEKIKNEKL